jgi:hypothetical protein
MRTNYSRPSFITIGVIIALGIVIPALAGYVLVLGLQGPAPTTIQNSGSPSPHASSSSGSPGPCVGSSAYTGLDAPVPKHDNTSVSFPIFSVPANGVAEVCVVYVDSDPPVNTTMDLTKGATVGTFGTVVYPNGTVKHPFMADSNITVTANQTKLALGGMGPAMVDVAYTIRTNGSATGFYFLNIGGLAPEACNNEFRFAVGYSFTQANRTGSYFPLPPGLSACTPSGGTISAYVYQVKGIVVTPLACGVVTCDLNDTE